MTAVAAVNDAVVKHGRCIAENEVGVTRDVAIEIVLPRPVVGEQRILKPQESGHS